MSNLRPASPNPATLQLVRVRLQNFKSISDASLELKPLNIILGSNSAGKSTFLQAIVLAAQNLRAGTTFSVDLNNPHLVLGPLKDLKHRGASNSSNVCIELEFGSDVEGAKHSYTTTIELDSRAKNLGKSSVPLAAFRIKERYQNENSELTIKLTSGDPSGIARMRGSFFAHKQFRNRPGLTEQSESQDSAPVNISAVFIPNQDDRFLPQLVGDRNVYLLEEIRKGLLERFVLEAARRGSATHRQLRLEDVLATLKKCQKLLSRQNSNGQSQSSKALHEWYSSWLLPKWEVTPAIVDILKLDSTEFGKLEAFKGLKNVTPEEFATFIGAKSRKSAIWLKKKHPQMLVISGVEQGSKYDAAVRFAARQFSMVTSKVQYLGPLRAHSLVDQKNAAPSHSWAPIGTKGELLAYHLGQENDRPRDFPVPNFKARKPSFGVENLTLQQALNRWINWFDLGNEIITKDEGVWGSYLELDAEKFHQKGTGISQVLPVLTICLLATKGSLTLIEQPELHLHPALQQKLGTFFAQISNSGRRLVIETHSEYLLTRIRREVSSGALDASSLALTFVNSRRSRRTGLRESTFEQIEISPTGSIARWPQAFYDFTAEDKLAIFEANIR